jgi:hypothetical protein
MKRLGVFFFFFFSLCIYAQQSLVPLNQEWLMEVEARMVENRGFKLDVAFIRYDADSAVRNFFAREVKASDSLTLAYPMHTSMRPWIEYGHPLRKMQNVINAHDRIPKLDSGLRSWLGSWHFGNSLLQLEREPTGTEPLFRLYIDPLLNMQVGATSDTIHGGRFWYNGRGIRAYGDVGRKISFETSFVENQALLPNFMTRYAQLTGVIPGQGRWKRFETSGYDYAMASGYLSYSPVNRLNIQIGHGKHFVGDGYRSLLLSDNSFNYPYLRFNAVVGKKSQFQYSALYASLINLSGSFAPIPPGTERLFQKKPAAFHQISWKLDRTAELSLFQGVVAQAADSTNRQRPSFTYFVPVFGLGPAIDGLNGANNFMMGLTFRVDYARTMTLYGQLMVDDIGSDVRIKMGYQLGMKYFDLFRIRHLHLQAEFNNASAFSYSTTTATQAWTHYNQPLAHPLGAAFSEVTAGLNYKVNDFFFQSRVNWASINVNDFYNRGQNIFLPDSTGITSPGKEVNLVYADFKIGYMISYASNLNISAGMILRNLTQSPLTQKENLFYVSLRTSISNFYSDFY